jgi:hypothetical protein
VVDKKPNFIEFYKKSGSFDSNGAAPAGLKMALHHQQCVRENRRKETADPSTTLRAFGMTKGAVSSIRRTMTSSPGEGRQFTILLKNRAGMQAAECLRPPCFKRDKPLTSP